MCDVVIQEVEKTIGVLGGALVVAVGEGCINLVEELVGRELVGAEKRAMLEEAVNARPEGMRSQEEFEDGGRTELGSKEEGRVAVGA